MQPDSCQFNASEPRRQLPTTSHGRPVISSSGARTSASFFPSGAHVEDRREVWARQRVHLVQDDHAVRESVQLAHEARPP